MNDSLVPEVRVNKNGVPVTKHVRVDLTNPAGYKSKLPPPSVQSPKTSTKKLPQSLTKSRQWQINKGLVRAELSIMNAVRPLLAPYMYYKFECSDAEAFEVMKVVDARNVIPLLAAGVRTKEAAEAFLDSKGLRGLTVDNEDFVMKVMSRGITPQAAIQMRSDLPDFSFDHPHYLDAMEAHGYKALREAEGNFGVTYRVLSGSISVSDIKVLGAVRAASGGANSQIMDELSMIHSGQSNMDAETLLRVITKSNPKNIKSDPFTVNTVVRQARVYGPETVLGVRRIEFMNSQIQAFSQLEEDNLEVGRMLVWQDKMDALKGEYMTPKTVADFYKAGIAVEEAAQRYKEGMTLNQYLGIKDGITPSVSGGWL
jgi:hypothetical protein